MRTWIASLVRTTLAGTLLLCNVPPFAAAAADPVEPILQKFAIAMRDPDAPASIVYQAHGAIVGSGLWGDFHQWVDGEHEREDDSFGPGTQQQFTDGDRVVTIDANGIVRELHGLLLRRARTQRLIDRGSFAADPHCCTLKAETKIAGRPVLELGVSAKDGEAESLFLDAHSMLPVRVEYDDADGRTTIDFSDWRSVAGRRIAFRKVQSNGDHRYDLKQTTETLDLGGPVDRSVFKVPPTRLVEIGEPQTIALESEGGHYFVGVVIGTSHLRFLLDSGSQDILVDRSVTKKLDLYEQGDLQAIGAARTGGIRIARVPKLCVGRACMRDVIVDTIDLRRSTEGAIRADGIIGYPFFAQALIELNLAGGTLRVGRPGAWPIGGERIPAEFDRSLPQATMRANGTEGSFLLDTGNSGDLMLFRPFLTLHPGLVASSFDVRAGVGVGGYSEMYRTALRSLRIGSFEVRDVPTDVVIAQQGAFADRSLAGDAGAGLLRRYLVTFDLPDDALFFAQT